MMNVKQVLLVDTDKKFATLLKQVFAEHRFEVTVCSNDSEARSFFTANLFDFVLLDVKPPTKNGLEICKFIRTQSHIPIIILSELGEVTDRIHGLELGADDYLVKPLELQELIARIKAVLRRTYFRELVGGSLTNKPERLLFEQMEIDLSQRKTWVNHALVELSSSEFEVLGYFARNWGRVVGRDELLAHLRCFDRESLSRAIDTLISRIRNKLGDCPTQPQFIKTVWGAGYIFVAAPLDKDQDESLSSPCSPLPSLSFGLSK